MSLYKLFSALFLLAIFIGGGSFIAMRFSQEVKIGQSFTLDEENGGKGLSDKMPDPVDEVSEDPGDEAAQLSQKASQREADLQLFLEEPYFRLPVITIPTLRNNKMHGILHLRIIMKSINHAGFQIAKVLIPRLVDAIYSDLYKAFSNLWLTEYDPSPVVIQKRIQKVTSDTLGKGIIDEIYLKEFFFTRNSF